MLRVVASALLCALITGASSAGQRPAQKALAPGDVDAIAQLVMLEDTRRFDAAILRAQLGSTHPEVRRRAIVSVGRIVNPAGRALLVPLRKDANQDLVATVAFATGQLKDPDAVSWLAELLLAKRTPAAVGREAAQALGKIRTPEARVALAKYLAAAADNAATAPVVGEALLAIGRFTTREDIAPIVRWTNSSNVDVRWRAAWALFRPRDPAAVSHLLKLTSDPSAEVRFWAMRGLAPTLVTEAGLDLAVTSARLREAVSDPDRRVRTEALRSLVLYDDDASYSVVIRALQSPDTWMSVSAAEGLGRFKARYVNAVDNLMAAASAGRPMWLRIATLAPLAALVPEAAAHTALGLARSESPFARTAAIQALQKMGDIGQIRLDILGIEAAAMAATPGPRPAPLKRSTEQYRAIVERLVVPDVSGVPRPRAVLTTPRGEIEVELNSGDAPLGVDYFVSVVESGAIVGTEFGRVVPNFVAQQRPIRDAQTLRDEVNRHGLNRGTLSWASAGLDTGRPGYTFASTPQPHNEGDFTALGRVVRGLDVVDRLELGDAITAARMVK
jgi:HEAT repeat protein/cyclophilin family peptidyl-prolyl cis-trans isomerase